MDVEESVAVAIVRLTPGGQLCLETEHSGAAVRGLDRLGHLFASDWREGLFTLAAEKLDAEHSPALHYWRSFSEEFLTALCHVPSGEDGSAALPAPSPAELAGRILASPPMPGGEYLSVETLEGIWTALAEWTRGEIESAGGLEPMLQRRAPRWGQVGRVCFHLAENRSSETHPFAFMATYSPGFGSGGRLKHVPLRRALEQYGGRRDRARLIKLLEPVQSAAEECDWVAEIVESGEIYQATAWTAERAYALLQSTPMLEECGLAVRLPNWWKQRSRPQVKVTIDRGQDALLGADAVLDFDVGLALGDQSLSEAELAELMAGDDGLVLFKGQWIEVDRERLREALDHWRRLREQAGPDGISFIEGMRLLAGASADLGDDEPLDADRAWVHVSAGDAMREILEALRDPARLARPDASSDLRAELRPYQAEGVAWLELVTGLGLGACLADDMGLGKTLQVLALLDAIRSRPENRSRRPSLLVIPASLLRNWRLEAMRFAPKLRLTFLHPAETDGATLGAIASSPARRLARTDLAVTTYSMLARQPWLAEADWRFVILDEAQAIKNPTTRQARAARKLRAQARVALTGTPIENRLEDLWSLFDFLNPGLLGSAKVFKSFVKELRTRDRDQFAPLRKLTAPYILRRLKTDGSIIRDLPEKTETAQYCLLTKSQVRCYQQVVHNMRQALEDAEGMARRGLVLQSLMRLKQVCNHPSQLLGDGAYHPADSGKFQRLGEICTELAERQVRVLVFTQFREVIDPLADYLARVFGRAGLVLHGGTTVKRRGSIVERFQRNDGPPFLILSLKAGGTGLNLTAASQVIHFDRWWNPAVEDQATDRAFRIGQHRNVLVHKFVTSGTIEERIDEMISGKRKLATEILSGQAEVNLTELSDDELMDLVRLDVSGTRM